MSHGSPPRKTPTELKRKLNEGDADSALANEWDKDC